MNTFKTSLYDWCIANGKEVILQEWDNEKNTCTPKDIGKGSHYKASWICFKCGEHYEKTVFDRTSQNDGCKKCIKKRALEKFNKTNIEQNGSLAETCPELLERWNFEKNEISPYEVTRYSRKEVWWKCPICGYSHKGKIIYTRVQKGCKRCRGNKYYFIKDDGTYTVYYHKTPDGKMYIGMTKDALKKRFGNGKLYKGMPFEKAINEFGWDNIEHGVLEYGLTKEEASEKEEYYINLYQTTNPEYGYNRATGGIHGKIYGRIITDEMRQHMSAAQKGHPCSEEARLNMSLAHKGKPSLRNKHVLQYDLDGNFIREFNSMTEVAKAFGKKTPTQISACCTGKTKTAYGYIWNYK